MRSPRLRCLAAFAIVAPLARAASFDDRVETLFRPPLGEMMALSPDGQRVAYTTRTRGNLSIVVMNVENPGPKRTIPVEVDRSATRTPDDSPPTQLRFLRWATDSRLIYAPAERVVPLPPITGKDGRPAPNPDGPTIIAPIMAADADGNQRGVLVDARNFQETPAEAVQSLSDLLLTPKELATSRGGAVHWKMPHLDILGFHPRDREQLIVGTRGGYSMPARHLVDIRTADVRAFGDEWAAPPGEPVVYDWFRFKVVGERQPSARPATAWQDADLDRAQRELAAKFPRRIVELLDWSNLRQRVLFRVTGGSDPGRVFVYQRPEDLVLEIFSRAPWLGAAKLHETRWFEFDAPDGAHLSGYVTWPTKPPPNPPPLLVMFPPAFPGRAQPAFDPEAQILADLGFAVVRLNHRYVAGVGEKDLPALRTAFDRMAINDGCTTIEWLAQRYPDRPFDRRRVAAFGRGFGGYLAVRALQLQAAVFHCGVGLDAPLEPGPGMRGTSPDTAESGREFPVGVFDQSAADRKKLSVLEQAESLVNPLLLLAEPGRNPAIEADVQRLRARLQPPGRTADYGTLDPGFYSGHPPSLATAYRKIEEFLHLSLKGSTVKIGAAEEVK